MSKMGIGTKNIIFLVYLRIFSDCLDEFNKIKKVTDVGKKQCTKEELIIINYFM